MMDRNQKTEAFGRLLDLMDTLREKCPWDRKQTNESLRKYTIEEAYELCDAILHNDLQSIRKELGDLLLHIVFYSKIGEEQGHYDIGEVIDSLINKLVVRHPHVFGEVEVQDALEVEQNWERIKLKEAESKSRVLSGVPALLPAMIKAVRIQEKARGVGFDWKEKADVWEKVKEELKELEYEIVKGDQAKMEAEFGDLLFSLINMSRLYEIDPELALERTNQKFIYRFNYMEDRALEENKNLHQLTLEEMEIYWNEAKIR